MATALFYIKNNTGSAVTYRGVSYSNGAFVPITGIVKGTYKCQRAKLWAKDTGRTLDGKFKGTLIGIYPKVTLTLGKLILTDDDVSAINALCEQPIADCKYYDSRRKVLSKAKKFYFDDITETYRTAYLGGANPQSIKFETLDITAVSIDKIKPSDF